MNITTILSELVLLADSLDKRSLTDAAAEVDAAVFLMSTEGALPRNKSLISVVKENYVAVASLDENTIEDLAVSAAAEISALTEEVLEADNKIIVAVLTSMAQSLRSVLHPDSTISAETIKKGSEFLAAAEKRLLHDTDQNGIGHRIGMVRAKLANV